MDNGIRYFWFPMDEFSSDIGLNSLFGALQILWIAEMSNKSVILHCHAGANRSPTVMEAYYFMRTKKHLIVEDSKEDVELFKQIFPNNDPDKWKNNRLLDNIDNGYLPALNKMEKFLKQCEKWFLKQDWENDFITESGLNKIKHDCKL